MVDSRKKGSQWTVQANSTKLKAKDGTALKGNLIYRDTNGKDHNLDGNIAVAYNTKDSDSTQTKNITDSWTSNSGILLLMDKDNKAGEYGGVINWSLLDSIPNE